MNLTAVLAKKLPPGEVEWSLNGDSLKDLVIHTAGVRKPTQAEVDTEWETLGPALEAKRTEAQTKKATRKDRLKAERDIVGGSGTRAAKDAAIQAFMDIVLDEVIE